MKKYIFILFIFLTVVVAWLYRDSFAKQAQSAPSISINAKIDSVEIKYPQKSLVVADSFIKEVTYSELSATATDVGSVFQFRLEPDEGCGVSDLDPILKDLSLAGQSELALSIESLPPSTVRWSTKFDVNHLKSGITLPLKFNIPSDPLYAGIFICRDSDGSGCASKEFGGYENLMRAQLKLPVLTGELKAYADKEKIYYFAPIVLSSNGIKIFDTHSMFVDGPEKFAGEIHKIFGDVPQMPFEIERANGLIKSVGLGAIQLKGSTLVLPIPTTKEGCLLVDSEAINTIEKGAQTNRK